MKKFLLLVKNFVHVLYIPVGTVYTISGASNGYFSEVIGGAILIITGFLIKYFKSKNFF